MNGCWMYKQTVLDNIRGSYIVSQGEGVVQSDIITCVLSFPVTTTVQVFVKKCSFSTNNPNIIISGDWYNISLIGQYCTGNLCNENPVTTANPTTEVVTRNVTDSPTKPVQPVTPAIQITTNGIGGIHSCYVTTILLVLMKSFL